MQHRPEKISSLLTHELAELIVRDVEVPGALITVEDVAVSDDLVQAKVTLSVLPYEKEVEAYKELEERKRELQHKILKKTRLRRVPTLKFEIRSQR